MIKLTITLKKNETWNIIVVTLTIRILIGIKYNNDNSNINDKIY